MSRVFSNISIALESGCAYSGRLDKLKEASRFRHLKCHQICDLAAKGGQFEVLKWAREQGYHWSSLTCTYAAGINRFDIVNWARDSGCRWSDLTLAAAVENENFDAVKQLCSRGITVSLHAYNAACKTGRIDIFQWLDSTSSTMVPTQTWEIAAKYGQLDMLKWAKNDGRHMTGVCRGAAEGGHLEVLKWAREVGFHWKSANQHDTICDLAAANGDLEMLQWAIEQGCPHSILSCAKNAAVNGRLEVLKWLQSRTTTKFDKCALEVLRLARKKRIEWGQRAAERYLEVLNWLSSNGCEWSLMVCKEADLNGYLNVLEWAYKNWSEICDRQCKSCSQNWSLVNVK